VNLAGIALACIATVWLLRMRSAPIAAIPWICSSLVILVLAALPAFEVPTPGLRQREVADYLATVSGTDSAQIQLLAPQRLFSAARLRDAIVFWDADPGGRAVVAALSEPEETTTMTCVTSPDGPTQADRDTSLLVTDTRLSRRAVFVSGSSEDEIFIYQIDANCLGEVSPDD